MCPAFEKISLQVRNIAKIAIVRSKTWIEKGWMNAGSVVGAIVLANEFSDLLGKSRSQTSLARFMQEILHNNVWRIHHYLLFSKIDCIVGKN